MKKGTLRLLPLQADLCLNKQKVDIEDFKGWNKNNAPVYGNCLSPLYKKNNTHHDFFIGDDKYDFTEGVLYKNGTAVLSGAGTRKVKKTRVAEDYSALAVSAVGTLTWLKEKSSTTIDYSINGSEVVTVSLSNALRIVSTKAFSNDENTIYGIAVLYLRTNGGYGYYLAWNDRGTGYTGYGASGQTVYNGFNVVAPLIQVGVFGEGKFMVSFFGKSGANVSDTDVRNVYVQNGTIYDNPTFVDGSNYPTRYETHSATTHAQVQFNTKLYTHDSQGTSYTDFGYGIRQWLRVIVQPHPYFPVYLDLMTYEPTKGTSRVETLTFPPSSQVVYYYRTVVYWKTDLILSQYYNVNVTVEEGSSTVVNQTITGTGIAPRINADYSDVSEYKCYRTYKRHSEPKSDLVYAKFYTHQLTNPNDVDNAAIYSTSPYGAGGGDIGTVGVDNSMNWNESGDGASGIPPRLINGTGKWWAVTQPNYGYKGGAIIFNNKAMNHDIDPNFFISNAGGPYLPDYTNVYQYGEKLIYFSGQYKTQYTEQALKEVDCCMDDGNLYCVGGMGYDEDTPLPTKVFSLSGVFSSFDSANNKINYSSSSVFNITYDLDDETNVFPKYYKGQTISLGNNYLRITFLFKAKQTDTQYINILIDSLALAEGDKAAHLYAGIQSDTNSNVQGGIKNTTPTSGFRLLFNNNLISNIACYEQRNYIGTILADWFTIDDTFCPAINASTLYYRDNNNKIWKVELVTSGQEWEYRLIENRYVVLNTVNYFNCYDTKTGVKRHWASDYNNRVLFGVDFYSYSNSSQFYGYLTSPLFSGLLITAQNANYEVTKDTITGIELGAIPYTRVLIDYIKFYSSDTPYGAVEGIDFYKADGGSTSALYFCSYQNSLKYIDNDLVNPYAVYPIPQDGDIRYNPNLFTRFISSYNNKDMVISDGVAYRLLYFNNVVPIMSYYLLDGVEELLDAFVLQSSYYGVSETRLYQMNYSNGVGVEVVCDITNLEYLGALPTQALFWSAQNRAIYSFKGNCIMSLSQYANDLEEIKGKWYNPATQELFLDTNIGLLVFSDLGTYCLPKFTVEIPPETEGGEPIYEERDIKDIFFYPDMFIINLEDDTDYSYYWSYNPLTGYESNGIHFVTKYYGNARTPITVNNIWIRLYNQDIAEAEGEITFKGHTVTDSGFQTDEKTVSIGGDSGEQWDAETNTMLVKYTPQFNRGLGFALEVHTTFPIIDIKYDYVEDGTIEGQIAHINI